MTAKSHQDRDVAHSLLILRWVMGVRFVGNRCSGRSFLARTAEPAWGLEGVGHVQRHAGQQGRGRPPAEAVDEVLQRGGAAPPVVARERPGRFDP